MPTPQSASGNSSPECEYRSYGVRRLNLYRSRISRPTSSPMATAPSAAEIQPTVRSRWGSTVSAESPASLISPAGSDSLELLAELPQQPNLRSKLMPNIIAQPTEIGRAHV